MPFNKKNFRPGGEIVCICGFLAKNDTSWDGVDAGRRYYKCASNGCNFHLWEDPPVCSRGRMVMADLVTKTQQLEEDIQHLIGMVEFFKDKVKKLQKREAELENREKGLVSLLLVLFVFIFFIFSPSMW